MKTDPERQQRLREARHLQALAGNPLTDEEIEMLEMFDREGWSRERRIAHILNLVKQAENTCSSK